MMYPNLVHRNGKTLQYKNKKKLNLMSLVLQMKFENIESKSKKKNVNMYMSKRKITKNKFRDIGEIYDQISILSLASYAPLRYVRPEKRKFYEEKYDMKTETGSVFKQVDREQSLIYLMRVNLLKRLESSIFSFKLAFFRNSFKALSSTSSLFFSSVACSNSFFSKYSASTLSDAVKSVLQATSGPAEGSFSSPPSLSRERLPSP